MNSNIIRNGKIINSILIILTVGLWATYQTLNRMIISGDASAMNTSVMISTVIMVIAIILLVISIILKVKNPGVKGLGLMIASAACLAVFSFLGMMLGLIVFILSGISIRQLSQSVSEQQFEQNL